MSVMLLMFFQHQPGDAFQSVVNTIVPWMIVDDAVQRLSMPSS
jgi:hypothetical protein